MYCSMENELVHVFDGLALTRTGHGRRAKHSMESLAESSMCNMSQILLLTLADAVAVSHMVLTWVSSSMVAVRWCHATMLRVP